MAGGVIWIIASGTQTVTSKCWLTAHRHGETCLCVPAMSSEHREYNPGGPTYIYTSEGRNTLGNSLPSGKCSICIPGPYHSILL